MGVPAKKRNSKVVGREGFLAAMAQAATTVTVVTTDGPGGRWGVTVSAMSSVSADPPLLSICLDRRNPVCGEITANRRFCVNVLDEGQDDVADVFAGRAPAEGGDRFACAAWEEGPDLPRLVGAAAYFDCVLATSHDHGTHRLFIGRVRTAGRAVARPLVYQARDYRRLCTHAAEACA
jgi:flavin reductase (DIM6/NTAB) family NADH-FMN oxidoreductase RutF